MIITQTKQVDNVIERLRREILAMQGLKKSFGEQGLDTGLGPLEKAFPDGRFPIGAIHEFISNRLSDAAATNGFISALLSKLMHGDGVCLWVSSRRCVFPPALKLFGIQPQKLIFIDGVRTKEALWTIEEALKCDALTGVIGELPELSFVESRRLQLAVESSHVTGFIHRHRPRSENTVACVTRWKIKSLPSNKQDTIPGVGLPRWNVELTKVRNGHPGSWQLEWANNRFEHLRKSHISIPKHSTRKTG